MAKSRGFTVEQKTSMRVAYEEGSILKTLAEKWQVSVPTMSKYIKSVGGTLRNAGTPKKVQDPGTPVIPAEFVPKQPDNFIAPAAEFTFMKENIQYPEPQPEIETPQAPVARRIIPFE